jgi:copper chaperone
MAGTRERSAIMKLTVEGMTCGHCVRTITNAIQALQPASRVGVDLESRIVSIDGDMDAAQAVAAIEAEGYRVVATDPGAMNEPAAACCGSCH